MAASATVVLKTAVMPAACMHGAGPAVGHGSAGGDGRLARRLPRVL